MKPIIKAVDKAYLLKELTPEKFIRKTNNADNELYIFTALDSPYLTQELGRLREITFREAGGGTGEPIDLDYYDTCPNPYKQLIVWDPHEKEILGGYRFIECKKAYQKQTNQYNLATTHLYTFSESFIESYLPKTIELGRSFVQPMYQSTQHSRKSLYALDNLWDGLGYLIINNPDISYFFGKVTMYNSYNKGARNILLSFLYHYFPDKFKLTIPKNPSFNIQDQHTFLKVFSLKNFDEDYKTLVHIIKEFGETIPPLINAYMKLSSTMITMGTSLNPKFGDVEETAILININDIYPSKKERHIVF